jgi:predicted PurR-regulated permease PerM
MTLQHKALFWSLAFAAVALVTWLLRDVLTPFAAGLVLAYLLDPLADRLEKWRLGRLGAALLIVVIFVAVLVGVLVLLAPLLANQLTSFIERMPVYVRQLQALLADQGGPLLRRIGGESVIQDLERSVGDLVGQGARWIGTFMTSLWSGGAALLNIVSLLVITPVVAFYLLLDWDRMIFAVDRLVPISQRTTVRVLAKDIDRAISGFVRGQTLVCVILGVMYAVGLYLVGLNFGVLIGLSAGLISFIPYVGTILGFVVAFGVALAQFWPDFTSIGLVCLVFAIGQFIEGNILSPKLVGGTVGLHPVWVMFALLAGGSLFGFLGLLIAVPMAAAIGVLIRFALGRYIASPLHGGGSPQPDAADARDA